MNRNLLILLGVGALAYYIWYNNKKNKTGIVVEDLKNNPEFVEKVVTRANDVEKSKYTNAFKKKFNIKIPANQASKAVKEAAFRMQERRYAKQVDAQLEKPEVYI
jgi:broad specificity polyphosphatase/5'/3'-nucleotidase SurE